MSIYPRRLIMTDYLREIYHTSALKILAVAMAMPAFFALIYEIFPNQLNQLNQNAVSIKDQIHKVDKRWFAVKCKYRCERTLMEDLKDQDINVYVPIQKKIRQYASRKKESEVALIPSHVFVNIIQSEYLKIIQHLHVYGFLNFSGVLCAIPDREMNIMRRVVGEVEDVRIDDATYVLGDTVQIIAGELTGLKGTLIEEGNHNFKIALESLGVGLTINVDPKQLIKIGSTKTMAATA